MRVLQATTAVGWSGGTEQALLLAKYMNELGIKTDILCFKGTELERRAKDFGINVRHFPNTKKFSLLEARKLSKIISGYDIVNTHISKAHWFVWISSFLSKNRPKIVYTRRVLFNISPISAFTKYKFNVDAIVGISKEICDKLKKFPLLKEKVKYIPSGVELKRFKPELETNLKEKLPIDKKSIVITHVANFSQVKGHYVLLPAFKKLSKAFKGKKITLLLVGRDTKGNESLELIKKLNLQSRVIPLGFRKDVPEILSISDIFVFPSISEGLGSSLIQAMAMKKIVVASYVGGIKDYLKHMENGIAVEPNSVESLYKGLLTALKNLNNEKMKDMARKTAEEFDINVIAKKTVNLYEELLNGKATKL